MIVDSAHNPAGMAAAMEALTEAFTFAAVIGVLAVSEDKDVPGILDQLEPVVSELVVTRNSSDRSMDPAKLAELAGGVSGRSGYTGPGGWMTPSSWPWGWPMRRPGTKG